MPKALLRKLMQDRYKSYIDQLNYSSFLRQCKLNGIAPYFTLFLLFDISEHNGILQTWQNYIVGNLGQGKAN